MRLRPLLLPATLAALAACAPRETVAPDFGAAVRHNMAVQIIPPEPDRDEPAGMDGRRAGDAWDRYRGGRTIPPVPMSTSDMPPVRMPAPR